MDQKYDNFLKAFIALQQIIVSGDFDHVRMHGLKEVIDSEIICLINDLFDNYLNGNNNDNIPELIKMSFSKYVQTTTQITLWICDISQYILCSSSLIFITDDKQVKLSMINRIFENLAKIEVNYDEGLDLKSVLGEIKKIKETKLKEIELNKYLKDGDVLKKSIPEFEYNRWSVVYDQWGDRRMVLHRL